MEIIQIDSAHSLVTSMVGSRPVEAHSYTVNCHQYESMYHKWQKSNKTAPQACGIMTLDYVRIWITEQEGKLIADAIKAAHSPVALG